MFQVIATLSNGRKLSAIINARSAADARWQVANVDTAGLVVACTATRVF
jgi:hypothetical protein